MENMFSQKNQQKSTDEKQKKKKKMKTEIHVLPSVNLYSADNLSIVYIANSAHLKERHQLSA